MTQDEVDRLILHSETRIKYWVIAGVVANMVALVGIGAPLIYYLGTMQAQTTAALATIQAANSQLVEMDKRLNQHEVWESNAETWMVQKGFIPPRSRGVAP